MTRLYVLVEGQTERAFVEDLMAPHLQARGIWTFAMIVETSRDPFGRKRAGGGRWKHWLRDLRINDGEETAPSKRLLELLPSYRKPLHGPLAVEAIGLDAVRRACPRFDAWLTTLEALGAQEQS